MLFQFVQSDLGKRTKGEEVEYINILDVKTIRRLTLLFIAIHIYIILQLQSSRPGCHEGFLCKIQSY